MSKVSLKIDNRKVEVEAGSTILDAARKLNIAIPTMCFKHGFNASTSCMLCVVKVAGRDGLVPACGALAQEGMIVDTTCDEVKEARTTALELLLSDHVGDCMGPCQVACPATMDIPLMIRQIAAGNLHEAIKTVKKDIALPAVLGRICPAPCEKVCRRSNYDQPLSICLLKRFVADKDLFSDKPYLADKEPDKQKKIAIVGAGPCGLACAYHLAQAGYNCTIFEDHEKPGGMLRYTVERDRLPHEVLDKEINLIFAMGVEFRGGIRVGVNVSMQQLKKDFDVVFIAAGVLKPENIQTFALESTPKGIKIDKATYQTSEKGVFAGGDATGKRQLAVRALADGKEAAESINQYLSGRQVTGPIKLFNSRMGRLMDGEMQVFISQVSEESRRKESTAAGLSDDDAVKEALRCLHCDCRKADDCRLRDYSSEYGARQAKYKSKRRTFVQEQSHPDIIYESGKCIDCGLCIQAAAEHKEALGLTFIGRGFNVRVAVPFDETLAVALKEAAKDCVEICPTGALSYK
jgi:ferredoxin